MLINKFAHSSSFFFYFLYWDDKFMHLCNLKFEFFCLVKCRVLAYFYDMFLGLPFGFGLEHFAFGY